MPNDPKPKDAPPEDGDDDDHGGSLANFFKKVESDPDHVEAED